MPASIPNGCPPAAIMAASPALLKMALVASVLVGGMTLLLSTPPAPSAALPDSCGAVMMALVQSGARDYRTASGVGYHYSYIPTPHAVSIMAAHSYDSLAEMRDNANQKGWTGKVDCRKPVAAQVAALDWPAPIPGITDVVAGVQ